MIRDIYTKKEFARVVSIVSMIMFAISLLATFGSMIAKSVGILESDDLSLLPIAATFTLGYLVLQFVSIYME